jgi:3-deoxy-D-manno-octulosonic-acid transferase
VSLLPIIERLALRGIAVLVTSGTRTSASLLARRLPPGAFHQFVPVDVPRYLRRFLDHWRLLCSCVRVAAT